MRTLFSINVIRTLLVFVNSLITYLVDLSVASCVCRWEHELKHLQLHIVDTYIEINCNLGCALFQELHSYR